MTSPLVVVAFLTGILLGWVGRSVRAASREIDLRCELADAEVAAAAATWAWEQLHKVVDHAFDDGYDQGWQNGVGVRVDLGEVEP